MSFRPPTTQTSVDKSKLFHFTDTQATGAWRERLSHERAPANYCTPVDNATDIGFRIVGCRTTNRLTGRRAHSKLRRHERSTEQTKSAARKKRDPNDPIYKDIEARLVALEDKLLKERAERLKAQTELKELKTKTVKQVRPWPKIKSTICSK